MKLRLLTLTSALAIMAAMPVMANEPQDHLSSKSSVNNPTVGVSGSASANANTKGSVGSVLERTGESVSEAANGAGDAVRETYESIRAAVIDGRSEDTATVTRINIDPRMTASGIIGKNIENNAGENLGTTEDIILGSNGKAEAVVISSGGFLGLGDKKAAFDYDLVMQRAADGDVVMPISQESIDKARVFSYDRADADENTRVMSENAISVKELIGSPLIDSNGKTVGEVDNVYFSGGMASRVIFSYNQTLGMGGEKAVMDFSALRLNRVDGGYQMAMNRTQSAQFENFRKSSTN